MLKIIKGVVLFVLDCLLFLIVWLVFGILFTIVTIYKTTIIFIANKLFKMELYNFDGLRLMDKMLLKTDYNNILKCKTRLYSDNLKENIKFCSNAGFVLTYEGNSFLLDNIRKIFYDKFFNKLNVKPKRKYLNLQVKLVKFCGYLFKKKVKNVDLQTQIYSVELSNSTTLEEFIADWYVQPFKSCVLWEVVSITNPTNNCKIVESYLAIKIHHCLADGYTLIHLLDTLCGNKTKYIVQDFKCSVWENILEYVRTPRILFTFLIKTFVLDKNQYFKNTSNNYKIHALFGSLDVHKLKLIKRKMNVTFKCIMHALLAGALRELYLAKKIVIPKSALILGTLPWPKHPFKERMTNWMSVAILEAPLTPMTMKGRLTIIERNLKQFHSKGLNKMIVRFFGAWLDLFPYFCYSGLYNLRVSACWSAILLGDSYQLFEKKISHIHVMGGMEWERAVITAGSVSYANQLDYTILACTELISRTELDEIISFISKELEQLYADMLLGKESLV